MVCDQFQGHLFSHPVPAAQAAQLIPEPLAFYFAVTARLYVAECVRKPSVAVIV